MSDGQLRYTVSVEPHLDLIAALEDYRDAVVLARHHSKRSEARIGLTPMGKHHRTIETWRDGEREVP